MFLVKPLEKNYVHFNTRKKFIICYYIQSHEKSQIVQNILVYNEEIINVFVKYLSVRFILGY